MSTKITLDSAQVLSIADQITADNALLLETLNASKSTIDGLSSTWTGQASEETMAAYSTFATQYFQTYYDVLEQYVKFLRTNVAAQYEEVETANTQLADAFQ
ncbi:MAG: WXG100 family type VII secretion target [Eubacteriales bacterium]